MSKPGEHKTVQARMLAYAQNVGWTIVSREEAEQRRGGKPQMGADKDSERHLRESVSSAVKDSSEGKGLSLFFDDLLDAKVREFNPRYTDAEGALLGQFRHLHTDIYGNRDFVDHLRNRGKFFDHEEKWERYLRLPQSLIFATIRKVSRPKLRICDI